MKKLYLMLAATLFASSASAVDYYMIGSDVNGKGWSLKEADCKFAETETTGVYEWTGTTLGTGFKINDGTWNNEKVNFGSNGSAIKTGVAYTYGVGGSTSDIQFQGVSKVYNPKVVLNVNEGTITVTGQEEVVTEVNYYIIGNNVNGKSWSLKAADAKFTETDTKGVYVWTGSTLGTGFKINDGTWGAVNYGSNGEPLVPNELYSFQNGGNPGNIEILGNSVIENPTVILNLNNNTIKIEVEEEFTYPEAIYLVGNINNGEFTFDNNLTFNAKEGEEGIYESEVTFTGTLGTGFSYFSFISNGSAASWDEVGTRYGARYSDYDVVLDEVMVLMPGSNAFKIADGKYVVNVNLGAGEITVSEVVVTPPTTNEVTFDFSTVAGIKECYSGDLDFSSSVKIDGVTLSKDGVKILLTKKSAANLPGPVFVQNAYTNPVYFLGLYKNDVFDMIAPEGKKFEKISIIGQHGFGYIEKIAVATEGAPALVPYRQNNMVVFEPAAEDDYTSLSFVSNTLSWVTQIEVVLADSSSIGTGVDSIEVEVSPVYYNMQGVRVAQPENGLYIEVRGNVVRKVMIRK